MAQNHYRIFLGHDLIGTTAFEKADAPMGVVTGRIDFLGIESAYYFIKDYCDKNGIVLNLDDPEFRAVETQTISELRVFNFEGKELKGEGCYVGGIEEEYFEITIFGIPYPFYAEQFPHYVKDYFGS